MTPSYLESTSDQVVKCVKEYPYPDDLFHTAVGFSRSTLLKAKEKQIQPEKLDLWLQRKEDT